MNVLYLRDDEWHEPFSMRNFTLGIFTKRTLCFPMCGYYRLRHYDYR
jgi:hypothetical protein